MSGQTRPFFKTEPHGQHQVELLEDASSPDNRIYEVRDRYEAGSAVRFLGSEIASLCHWWVGETARWGSDSEDI
jgi:hypothetical protein